MMLYQTKDEPKTKETRSCTIPGKVVNSIRINQPFLPPYSDIIRDSSLILFY